MARTARLRDLGPSPRLALSAIALLAVILVGRAAGASDVLPPRTGEKLLEALAPYGPQRPVTERWRIGNISISEATIRLNLEASDARAALILQRPPLDGAFAETKSFAVRLESPRAEPPPDLVEAASRVVSKLRAGDPGDFFVDPSDARHARWDGAETDQDPPWALPIELVLLLLLAAAIGLALSDRSAPERARGPPAPAWLEHGVPVALLLLSFVAICSLSPMSLLHEGSHGPRYLELFAGLWEESRPMLGQSGLQRIAGWFVEPSIASVTTTTALVASFQGPLVFRLGRSLGLDGAAAAASGLLAATLPVVVRMSGSEDAFPAATTFLVAGAWAVTVAGRASSPRWFFASILFVALAGHFRPAAYVAMAPIGLGLLCLSPAGQRLRWLRSWELYAGVALFLVAAADDLPAIAGTLGEGTALSPGWWQGPGLRNWPLLDPAATSPLLLVLMAAALPLALARRWRARTLWLLVLLASLTFLYTAVRGWAAALRYALSYAWIVPVIIGIALHRLRELAPHRWTGRLALGVVALLAFGGLWSYQGFIGHRYAQQLELDFQQREVVPLLLAGEPAIIVRQPREAELVSSTLLSTPLLLAGHRVVSMQGYAELSRQRRDTPAYYYRGLSCWLRAFHEAERPASGMRSLCQEFERSQRLRPVVTTVLAPDSDTDGLHIGDGNPVEVGLFRIGGSGRREPWQRTGHTPAGLPPSP